jgi:ACS family tartrate transporter-like MFS transporter
MAISVAGAFAGPLLWGMARDATGTFNAGLMSVAAAFLAAAVLILLMRHSARQAALLTPPAAVETAPAL